MVKRKYNKKEIANSDDLHLDEMKNYPEVDYFKPKRKREKASM